MAFLLPARIALPSAWPEPSHCTPAAREINQLTLTTELPRNRVIMLLLEAAWAQIYGIAIPATASLTVSPELAAIRDVLWPGGDMENEWSPDTIEEVARIALPHGQNGGTKGGHRG